MNSAEIAERTAAFLNSFLEKEGYVLLKTEYVTEDGIHYLRAYLDLTEKEKAKRKEQREKEKLLRAEKEEIYPEEMEPEESGEVTETSEKENSDDEIPEEPGIGINDCANVSRRLSKWLDMEDFIPDEYMLEVCSKGYLNNTEIND